ncbi:MAG: sensor histidine kinase KdpD [Phycisphaerales bacterium]|nr:sensor histidine kinase KdpD [Phycisphaerales bacterium]
MEELVKFEEEESSHEKNSGKVDYFLEMIQKSRRGKFKVYIGMAPGVGKTYRMLQEAHAMLKNEIDIVIGYIESHNRTETEALVAGIPNIPRKNIFYKGKKIEEMDLNAILVRHPEVVIVDELAHSNIEGSKNEKRWEDVIEILNAGISVISAINIQHIESLNEDVQEITKAKITERVPDSVLKLADEIVNIDLTADDLLDRLRDGKIYDKAKVAIALQNFFKQETLLQLREFALREVALHVERKISLDLPKNSYLKADRLMACISTNPDSAKMIIRKTARLASFYNCKWYVLYVQKPQESGERISSILGKELIANFKMATQMGGEVIKLKHHSIVDAIMDVAFKEEITFICIGAPRFHYIKFLFGLNILNKLLKKIVLAETIDIMVLS